MAFRQEGETPVSGLLVEVGLLHQIWKPAKQKLLTDPQGLTGCYFLRGGTRDFVPQPVVVTCREAASVECCPPYPGAAGALRRLCWRCELAAEAVGTSALPVLGGQ